MFWLTQFADHPFDIDSAKIDLSARDGNDAFAALCQGAHQMLPDESACIQGQYVITHP
jgi:hypothetical protein